MERVGYRGWEDCRRLANGAVEMIVTADVGPRIIRFGFEGGDNVLKEFDEMMGRTGGDEWLIYGGHRLWHAPEEKPRTYFPDNAPVEVKDEGCCVKFIAPRETTTGIEKEMRVSLDDRAARAEIVHVIRNTNLWAVELAPWALTVMAQGGKAVIPLPPRGSHEEFLLPANSMTMWAYTDMADPRWTWGSRFVMLRQDPAAERPQKVGFSVPDGWAAYAIGGNLLVKRFRFDPSATYPDLGVNVETFTNADFLELETLGPMTKLEPGACAEHVERWYLFKDVPVPETDADVEKHVLPKVAETEAV